MWDWRLKLSRNKVIVGEPAVGELNVPFKKIDVFKIIKNFNINLSETNVKSVWPLWIGQHPCYKGSYNRKRLCK